MEKSRKILKIIIIGDSEVGKTALITRFVDKTFQKKYIPVRSASHPFLIIF
jgi:GTPase SAR1 family protein